MYPFVYQKCGKEGKIFQKFGYLENEKSFLVEIKKHFSQFLKGYHFVKKNLIRNSEHKLKVLKYWTKRVELY